MLKYLALLIFCFALVMAQSGRQPRILNGFDVLSGDFPSQVSIAINGSHFCSGTILSRSYVTTIAHLLGPVDYHYFVRTVPLDQITVRAGSVDLRKMKFVVNVEGVFVNDDFLEWVDTIIILKLAEPLRYTRTIQPAALARFKPEPNETVITMGWGYESADGTIDGSKEKWINLTTTSPKRCTDYIKYHSEKYLCFEQTQTVATCNGDSGGAAFNFNKELVGLNSYTEGVCGDGQPQIFINVAFYVGWIKKMIHSDH